MIGIVSFATVEEDLDEWPDEIVKRLELVSHIFANALMRKRADEALREPEERLQLAADSAEIGMWSFDIESQLLWTNNRGREIFGYEPDEEITLARFLDSVHPACVETVTETVRRAIEEGLKIDTEYRVTHPDGSEKWIHSCGRMQPEGVARSARLLGVSALRETYSTQESGDWSTELALAGDYGLFLFQGRETSLTTSLSALPSLSVSGRYRVEYGASLKRKMIRDFTLSINLNGSYDSMPPENSKASDTSVSFNLGWSY